MILRHPTLEQELEWTESQHVCELVIECPKFLREIVKDLTINEGERSLSITADGSALNFDKEVDVIFNPLKLDFNNKRAIVTLLKFLVKTSVSEEFYIATNTFKSKIIKYLDEIIDTGAFEFEVSTDDFAIDSIAKAVSLHIVGDEDDFAELLTDYVSMMAELTSVKLFVFINLRSFMANEDLLRFHHNLDNHQIDVLLLETHNKNALEQVPRLVVDEDMCEI